MFGIFYIGMPYFGQGTATVQSPPIPPVPPVPPAQGGAFAVAPWMLPERHEHRSQPGHLVGLVEKNQTIEDALRRVRREQIERDIAEDDMEVLRVFETVWREVQS